MKLYKMPTLSLEEFQRDIDRLLLELKVSMEAPSLFSEIAHSNQQASLEIQALLEIEKARMFLRRFPYFLRRKQRLIADLSYPYQAEARTIISHLVDYLERYFASELPERKRRPLPIGRLRNSRFSPFANELALKMRPSTPTELLSLIENYIYQVEIVIEKNGDLFDAGGARVDDQAAVAGMLRRIVPLQQAAPAQFEIKNSRVVVLHANNAPKQADADNARAALDHLKSAGENLISGLLNSNCDGRLLSSVKDLQAQLVDNENVVKLGLANLASEAMCNEFRAELPDALAAMFRSFTTAISQYLAQFPDWQRFTQNAQDIELDALDKDELIGATGYLIDAIEQDPELADPEVPKTIKLIREFLRDPKLAFKRGAYAVIKTIENFVSAICDYASKLVSSIAEKSIESISSIVTSKKIIGLLLLAVAGANAVGPTAAIIGSPWVQNAGDLAQTLITQLTSK